MRFILILSCIISFAFAKGSNHKAHRETQPKVVVTIAPLHSLVAGVMEGIAEPELLIEAKQSAHGYSLKPSEAAKLNNANVIVWVGPEYETTFKGSIDATKAKYKISMTQTEGVNLLPLRTFKDQPQMCCPVDLPIGCDCEHHKDHHHEISGKDGHLWLAVPNAKALVTKITQILSELDQRHAADYLANSKKVIAKLNQLNTDIFTEIKSVKGKQYLTYHDFTQYFDISYGTKCVGAIRIHADREPTAEDIKRVNEFANAGAVAIFSEPQFETKTLTKISKESGVTYAQIDALGVGLTPGQDLYFEMMRRLMNDMKKALEN